MEEQNNDNGEGDGIAEAPEREPPMERQGR